MVRTAFSRGLGLCDLRRALRAHCFCAARARLFRRIAGRIRADDYQQLTVQDLFDHGLASRVCSSCPASDRPSVLGA